MEIKKKHTHTVATSNGQTSNVSAYACAYKPEKAKQTNTIYNQIIERKKTYTQ